MLDARLERLWQLTRTHTRMRDVATKLKDQLHRLQDEGGLRIGGILTDVLGASGRHLLEGLVRRDNVEALLERVKGKARAKLDRLRAARGGGRVGRGRTGHGALRIGSAAGELGRRVPRQPRVRGQAGQPPDAQA